jgi:phenylacetate-coenzyme A ligase PaaK-like adenylate-forming protein
MNDANHSFSLGPEQADAALHVAQGNLKRLLGVPDLADHYEGHSSILGLDDLAELPVMDKDQLNVALSALQPQAEQGAGATWLFQSGGSTGAPKVGYAPTGFYMSGVFAQWRALDRDDVFVNVWGAGRMWGAHFLAAAYADLAECRVIGVGAVTQDEYADWLGFFAAQKVTAIGGTPSVLRLWFAHAREAGIQLPALRKVLWLGEAWHPQMDEDLAAVAPLAQRWGMFGSTETWVVGTNTPACAVDTFHPLPEQLVHAGDDNLLDFTTLNPDMLNPVLRYRTGDAGEITRCPCGEPGPAFRVHGRRDSVVSVRGLGLHVDDLVARAEAFPGVVRGQIVITEQKGRATGVDLLLIAEADADSDLAGRVRADLFGSTFTLSTAFVHDPDSFRVLLVTSLETNPRTGKTASFVVKELA